MVYLVSQIFLCLLVAALIGGVIGWLLRGQGAAASRAEQEGRWSERLATAERERDRLSEMNESLVGQLDELQRQAAPTAVKEAAPRTEAERPSRALAAPEGEADDLQRIKGVGPKLSSLLNELGIYRFRQIASFTPEEIEWVGSHLKAFKGRITRDGWIEQARQLHFEKYGERL